jgi:hypothetical protein
MKAELWVVAIGTIAGAALAVLPTGIAPLVAAGAAIGAGWIMSLRPGLAAVLVVVPTACVGFLRVLADPDVGVGAILISTIFATVLAAVCTHIGGGMALRRRGSQEGEQTRQPGTD